MAHTYNLLRVTTDLTDDADHVLLQTAPADLALLVIPSSKRVVSVEFVLEWVNNDLNPVLGGRGTYSCRVIRKMQRHHLGRGLAGLVPLYVDVAAITLVPAYRPLLVTDIVPGDELGVLLTDMVAPAGATRARVFYREIMN